MLTGFTSILELDKLSDICLSISFWDSSLFTSSLGSSYFVSSLVSAATKPLSSMSSVGASAPVWSCTGGRSGVYVKELMLWTWGELDGSCPLLFHEDNNDLNSSGVKKSIYRFTSCKGGGNCSEIWNNG